MTLTLFNPKKTERTTQEEQGRLRSIHFGKHI